MMQRFSADWLALNAVEQDKTHAFPNNLTGELATLGGMAMKVYTDEDNL